jgi:hypothetical protein
MYRGYIVRSLALSILLAAPASAAFTEFTSSTAPIDWYATYNNITTFDGIADTQCKAASPCTLGGIDFYGLWNAVGYVSTNLRLISENEQTWFNYGKSDPYGNPATSPGILVSASADTSSILVGFRIVLPAPVTAFGVQIMGSPSDGDYHVAVNASGGTTSTAGTGVQAGTLLTAANHGRTFIGLTSDTTFTTIDIIGYPGKPGEFLVIDNIGYGYVTPTGGSDTPELQSVFFLLTGLAAITIGHRRRLAQQ